MRSVWKEGRNFGTLKDSSSVFDVFDTVGIRHLLSQLPWEIDAGVCLFHSHRVVACFKWPACTTRQKEERSLAKQGQAHTLIRATPSQTGLPGTCRSHDEIGMLFI